MHLLVFSWCGLYDIIVGILLKAIPLIISTIIGTWIVRKAFLPKVDIKTNKEHILYDKDGCFLSLNLVNVGPNVAQNCCAYIILDRAINFNDLLNPDEAAIDEHLPGYAEEKNNFEIPRNTLITREKIRDVMQIQLCWTQHGNPYEKNINPGVQAQIDICRFQIPRDKSAQQYIIFPTERGWRRVHFRLRYQALSGTLYICPANSYPNIFTISFELDSNLTPKIFVKKAFWWPHSRRKLLLQ